MSGRQSAEDGPRADPGHGARGGDEGVGGYDDLVAGPDPARAQREFDGVGAVGDAHAVRDAAEVGVLALEGPHLVAADEGGVGQDPFESGPYLVGDLLRGPP